MGVEGVHHTFAARFYNDIAKLQLYDLMESFSMSIGFNLIWSRTTRGGAGKGSNQAPTVIPNDTVDTHLQ